MSETNDSVVETQETSTGEETVAETKDTQSQDLSAVLAKLEEFGNDIASLKRTAKKAKTEKTETPNKSTSDNSELSEKYDFLLMKQTGLEKDTEQALAKKLQEETKLPMEKLLDSRYFKSELEDLRVTEANAAATGGLKGDKTGGTNVKQSAEYWIAKGEYPTREQVSDRKVRAEIRKAMVSKQKGTTGQFYNS